jgi:hypothetical protein
VAEGFFAEASEIDLLAVGSRDEWVAVRIAESGQDRENLALALSDLAWLRRRSPGLLKLAPELGVDPHQPPRALIYAEILSRDTRCAIEVLPEGWVSAHRVIPLEQQGRLTLLPVPQEAVPAAQARSTAGSTAPRRAEDEKTAGRRPGHGHQRPKEPPPSGPLDGLTQPPAPSRFRTGLTDSDLEPLPGLAAAEPTGG